MKEIFDIYLYTLDPQTRLPQDQMPGSAVQSCPWLGSFPRCSHVRCLDAAFPAHSPGFAEVCAPFGRTGGLEGQKFGSPFQIVYFFS